MEFTHISIEIGVVLHIPDLGSLLWAKSHHVMDEFHCFNADVLALGLSDFLEVPDPSRYYPPVVRFSPIVFLFEDAASCQNVVVCHS